AERGGASVPVIEPREADGSRGTWESVLRTRGENWPRATELLAACTSELTEIRGDRIGGGDDLACVAGIALLLGRPVGVVAQVQARQGGTTAKMTPAGFRKARRLLRLAEELGLPVVSVIDTPGPELSASAEASGLATEIAATLADLSDLSTPTVAVLLGQGGGGGAMAFLLADRVIAADSAWLAPIAPEGASSILYRTQDRASGVATSQHISSPDLAQMGIVDTLVPGPSASPEGAAGFLARMGRTLAATLEDLAVEGSRSLQARRAARYRNIGSSFVTPGNLPIPPRPGPPVPLGEAVAEDERRSSTPSADDASHGPVPGVPHG
ncbi:MAG TPA: carboxyl transferase domain-containing protein, partial [Acidimicrobiales bacterium]|nr:carboxyl transferase domain-containing protein [Acidimicrobiales bacterium]